MAVSLKEDEAKKPNWLDGVRQAAKLNYLRGLKEQEEKQRIAEATNQGRLDELINEEFNARKKANATKTTEQKGDK